MKAPARFSPRLVRRRKAIQQCHYSVIGDRVAEVSIRLELSDVKKLVRRCLVRKRRIPITVLSHQNFLVAGERRFQIKQETSSSPG